VLLYLCCAGLEACRELRQLHITDCGVQRLTACSVLKHLTELRLLYGYRGLYILTFVANAMPQLVTADQHAVGC
jgi:hypothetical protein